MALYRQKTFAGGKVSPEDLIRNSRLAGALSQTINLTVNSPNGTPDEIKQAVKSAIDESNEKLLREGERSLRPAVAE